MVIFFHFAMEMLYIHDFTHSFGHSFIHFPRFATLAKFFRVILNMLAAYTKTPGPYPKKLG